MIKTILNFFLIYFNLVECNCNEEGSSSFICNVETGQCPCKNDLITGKNCDESIPGYYGFPEPQGNFTRKKILDFDS